MVLPLVIVLPLLDGIAAPDGGVLPPVNDATTPVLRLMDDVSPGKEVPLDDIAAPGGDGVLPLVAPSGGVLPLIEDVAAPGSKVLTLVDDVAETNDVAADNVVADDVVEDGVAAEDSVADDIAADDIAADDVAAGMVAALDSREGRANDAAAGADRGGEVVLMLIVTTSRNGAACESEGCKRWGMSLK